VATELTPFSYCILALVGRGGAGPHDLARMMREGQGIWEAARSQYYAEPKRLERLGYLASAKQPGQTTERTHYTLTAKGAEALTRWLAAPTRYSRIQSEPAIHLLAADHVDDEVTVRSLAGMREQLAEVKEGLARAEARAHEFPHRERYLRINHTFMRAIVQAHEDLVDRVEEELGR
jgi:PadR family transcriptional regulator, regulatory protein AphA